jgi:hypothetical protein
LAEGWLGLSGRVFKGVLMMLKLLKRHEFEKILELLKKKQNRLTHNDISLTDYNKFDRL